MKQAFLNYSVSFILNNQDKYSEKDKDKLLYGLEGIYLTITKTVILLFISLLMGFTKEFLICLILFNIIRYPAFGFHADSSQKCLILSGAVFLGFTYLFLHIPITIFLKISLYSIIFLIFLFCAPADTPKRPLTNRKKRHLRKLASVILISIYGIIIFVFDAPVSTYFLIAALIEAIFISPIPYWVFKQPYQNYKKLV